MRPTRNTDRMASSISIALICVMCRIHLAAANVVSVNTDQGLVTGYSDTSTHGRRFLAFNGIPYAKAPVGALRFQDPEPLDHWEGVVNGSDAAPPCPQYDYLHMLAGDWTHLIGQENCLIVNVFTPQIESSSTLPVMVYIHGGGWFVGGAAAFPPHAIMNADVVLVVLQYRLGMLGFLSTEDEAAPGNLGLKDQALALRWVQGNIRHFGGDADSVTVFGESAGSASINFHILNTKSRGLFHRAIMQSGQATCPLGTTKNPLLTAKKIAEELHCPTDSTEQLINCLQSKPLEIVAPTFAPFFEFGLLPLVAAPYVDGEYLTDHPATLLAQGRYPPMDVIIGVTSHEGAFISTMVYSEAVTFSQLQEQFASVAPLSLGFSPSDYQPHQLADKIYQQYLADDRNFSRKTDEFNQMLSDRYFTVLSDNTAAAFIRHADHNKVFMYDFEYRGSQSYLDDFDMKFVGDKDSLDTWVSHADELPYLFPGYEFNRNGLGAADQGVSDVMVKLWTNFARHGVPTPDDSLGFEWKAAESDSLRRLAIRAQPAMAPDYRSQVRAFWDSLPLVENVLTHPEYFPTAAEHFRQLKQKGQSKLEL